MEGEAVTVRRRVKVRGKEGRVELRKSRLVRAAMFRGEVVVGVVCWRSGIKRKGICGVSQICLKSTLHSELRKLRNL
jgi:hypothetical protein